MFLSPLGPLLSNESVCELMQACFRMCFIDRANELLRKSAETALTDMIRLLFSRLHTFPTVESMKKYNKASPAQAPHIVFDHPPTSPIPTECEGPVPEGIQNTVEEGKGENVEGMTPEQRVSDVTPEVLSISTVAEGASTKPIQLESKVEEIIPLVAQLEEGDHHEPPSIHVEEPTPPEKTAIPKSEFKNSSGVCHFLFSCTAPFITCIIFTKNFFRSNSQSEMKQL